MPGKQHILLLSDSPTSQFAQHLALLYPNRVTALDFTTEDHRLSILRKYCDNPRASGPGSRRYCCRR